LDFPAKGFFISGCFSYFLSCFLSEMKRLLICLFLIFFSTVISVVIVLAQRELVPENPGVIDKSTVVEPEQKNVIKKRIREGTAFQGKKVYFRPTGNRTTLYTEENERFVCLENQNLERILRSIEAKPLRTTWKIDGEFTEFRGENYILIRRAVTAPEAVTVPATPVAAPPTAPASPTAAPPKKSK
jgi:hypothetical protein